MLCALATLPRSALKTQILENSTFGVYVEQEPYVRELVEAYLSSNFKTVLELLNRYSARHALDIYLAPHVAALANMIRNWAVVLYFQPFASIKLERMSGAFGWTVGEVEEQVVALIQSGDIHGRVDSQNKVPPTLCLKSIFIKHTHRFCTQGRRTTARSCLRARSRLRGTSSRRTARSSSACVCASFYLPSFRSGSWRIRAHLFFYPGNKRT